MCSYGIYQRTYVDCNYRLSVTDSTVWLNFDANSHAVIHFILIHPHKTCMENWTAIVLVLWVGVGWLAILLYLVHRATHVNITSMLCMLSYVFSFTFSFLSSKLVLWMNSTLGLLQHESCHPDTPTSILPVNICNINTASFLIRTADTQTFHVCGIPWNLTRVHNVRGGP